MVAFNKRTLQTLCTPAYLYFVVSAAAIIISAFHNRANRRTYALGKMRWPVPHTAGVFLVKVAQVLFWTWMLNLMCKAGYPSIAWALVLLPFIIGILVVIQCNSMRPREPYKSNKKTF